MLYARYKAKILSRWDVITNPFLTICDLPWVVMTLLTLLLAPWRFYFTFLNYAKHHSHFPNDEVKVIRMDLIELTLAEALLDYVHIPFYILACFNPLHLSPVVLDLVLSPMRVEQDFKNLQASTDFESNRRLLVRKLAEKTLHDTWNYFILFPLNMLSLYFVPLFNYLLTSSLTDKDPKLTD
jgi:hypothetical protein